MGMTYKSHLTMGAIGALAVAPGGIIFSSQPLYLSFYLFLFPSILFGSVLPDLDEPKSFIGKMLPFISKPLSKIITHRGFTHMLLFPIALTASAEYFLNGIHQDIIFALSFGIFIHQIGDLLTRGGINYYFFPFPIRIVGLLPWRLRFYTGRTGEKFVYSLILYPSLVILSYLTILNSCNSLTNFLKELIYYYNSIVNNIILQYL